MRRRTLTVAATAAMALMTLGVPAAIAGGGTVRMVDDDGRASPGDCAGDASARARIQRAVDDATDGDTILVCPGTYPENVRVAGLDDLTLRTVTPWTATIESPSGDAPAIVTIVTSDRVTFQGFRVLARVVDAEICDTPVVGVLIVAARDFQVRGNRVRAVGDTLGACGLQAGIMAGYVFGGDTARARIAGVGPAGGPDHTVTTGLIAYNMVRDHSIIGIAAVSTDLAEGIPTATRVDIRNNSVRYLHLDEEAQDCVIPIGSSAQRRSLRRALARISPAGPGPACVGVGIYMGVGEPDSRIPGASGQVSRNRVFSGPDADVIGFGTAGEDTTAALVMGILLVDPRHRDGASDVRRNLVLRTSVGIAAVDAKGAVVRGNRVGPGVFGIVVWDTVGAVVRGNRTLGNIEGISVSDAPLTETPEPYHVTRNNVFLANDARDNFDLSCLDETLGDGTLGTDNTWTDNDGEPGSSDPGGICGPVGP